jgi:hypothetical protein
LVLLVAMIAVSLAKAVVPAGPCPIRKTLFSRFAGPRRMHRSDKPKRSLP